MKMRNLDDLVVYLQYDLDRRIRAMEENERLLRLLEEEELVEKDG